MGLLHQLRCSNDPLPCHFEDEFLIFIGGRFKHLKQSPGSGFYPKRLQGVCHGSHSEPHKEVNEGMAKNEKRASLPMRALPGEENLSFLGKDYSLNNS